MVVLLAIFLIGIIACCVALPISRYYRLGGLRPQSMTNVSQTLYVYDNNGQEVAGIYNKENRTYVGIDAIPRHVQDAFIAIEDTRSIITMV